MLPYITFFGRNISTYALMALIGILLCGFLFCRRIRRLNLDSTDAIIVLLISAVGVLIGGSLLYALTNFRYWKLIFTVSSFGEFWILITSIFGGSVFYGGLIGGLTTGLICIHVMKLPLATYADNIAPLVPLFHAIARIGCFLGGCCYGIESAFGFTVTGNTLIPSLNGVRRFPVQLLEAICNLLICLILWILLRKLSDASRLRGKLLPLYLVIYAVIRFFIEFLRGDEHRGFIGIFSTSQFISLLLCGVALICLIHALTKKQTPTE